MAVLDVFDRYFSPVGSQMLRLKNNKGIATGAFSGTPTAEVERRGMKWRTEGATGVSDTLAMITKMANDSYANAVVQRDAVDLPAIVNASDVTLTNGTSLQSPFAAANDTLTVEAGIWYGFKGRLYLTGGTTSHTVAFTLKGGGTATITSILYTTLHSQSAAATIATAVDRLTTVSDNGAGTVCTGAVTVATSTIEVEGRVLINAAGTLIPQIKYSADPTGTLLCVTGSFLELRRLSGAAIGPWA